MAHRARDCCLSATSTSYSHCLAPIADIAYQNKAVIYDPSQPDLPSSLKRGAKMDQKLSWTKPNTPRAVFPVPPLLSG
jgi:hypothetical protein